MTGNATNQPLMIAISLVVRYFVKRNMRGSFAIRPQAWKIRL